MIFRTSNGQTCQNTEIFEKFEMWDVVCFWNANWAHVSNRHNNRRNVEDDECIRKEAGLFQTLSSIHQVYNTPLESIFRRQSIKDYIWLF